MAEANATAKATPAAAKRKPIIGGNWKSNGTKASVEELVTKLNAAQFDAKTVDVVVAPTALHLGLVRATLRKDVAVAAQNTSKYGVGAYTGELAAVQLKDGGAEWVLVGHSERRHLLRETDADVKDKVHVALKAGLSVIACVGELLSERKAGQTVEVVTRQLAAVAAGVEAAVADPHSSLHNATNAAAGRDDAWGRVVLAYEPVWAIGTGVVATPAEAQTVHAAIRAWLRDAPKLAGPAVAAAVRIQYGGSVTKASCDALIVEPDVDGFLVGGASLHADDFAWIVGAPARKADDKAKALAAAAAAAAATAAPAK